MTIEMSEKRKKYDREFRDGAVGSSRILVSHGQGFRDFPNPRGCGPSQSGTGLDQTRLGLPRHSPGSNNATEPRRRPPSRPFMPSAIRSGPSSR